MPNTNTKSYNTIVGLTPKQYLLPGFVQIFLYLLLSLFVLMALNTRNIWHYFKDVTVLPNGSTDNSTDLANRGWHLISHGVWLQILFWVLVGCLVYIFIWFLSNLIANIRNDIVADQYKHPSTYSRLKFWESVLSRKVFFGFCVIVLIVYLWFFVLMANLLAKLCYSAFTNFGWLSSTGELLGAVISCAFLIYLLVLLVHITANSWRLIFKEF